MSAEGIAALKSHPDIVAIQQWLVEHESELLEQTRKLLRFNTIEGNPEPNAPYGKGNREALDYCLQLAKEAGWETVDLEGHLGYATFGQGDRLVMALGHIDVVPVSPDWKHDPFGAEIDGEYIYARGTTDDKGPTMAAWFAMRAIQAIKPDLSARLRMAFGCNEESGFGCVERYVQTEEAPTFGVAPDSGWPCYNAEKGIANLELSVRVPSGDFRLLEFVGGSRPNIVIDRIDFAVEAEGAALDLLKTAVADNWDKNLVLILEGSKVRGVAHGKAAHGSTPFMGDSAATRAVRFLLAACPLDQKEFYENLLVATHPSGVGLGIHGRDDVAGDLTANVGICSLAGDKLDILVNVRYPVKWTGAHLEELCRTKLAALGEEWQLEVTRDSPPLYFPIEHPMVKTIIDVYESETGERRTPGAMGGGTYARAVPNTISIGTGWIGDGDAHENDERIAIQSLFRMSRIYAHILYRLATMEA